MGEHFVGNPQIIPGEKNFRHHNMKDHMAAFQEHRRAAITFDSFDFNLYESLVNYLTHDYVQRRRSEVIDCKKEQIKRLKTLP